MREAGKGKGWSNADKQILRCKTLCRLGFLAGMLLIRYLIHALLHMRVRSEVYIPACGWEGRRERRQATVKMEANEQAVIRYLYMYLDIN